MRSKSLLMPVPPAPTAQEVAMRPELVRQMCETIRDKVNDMDIEHMVSIGITCDGAPRIFHTYGRDLPLLEVAQLLEDIATMAREQDAKGKSND